MSQNFMGAEITILPLQLSGFGELQVWGVFMKPAWPYSAPLQVTEEQRERKIFPKTAQTDYTN